MSEEQVYGVDFETYYDKDYSVKNMPIPLYCMDDRFDPYLVSIYGPGVEFVGHPTDAPWQKINRHVWISHNANFDQQVFLACVARQLISNKIGPTQWYCSADMSVYLSGPRALDKCCEMMLDVKISKDVRAKAKGTDFTKEGGTTFINGQGTFDDHEYEEMKEYALGDAKYCRELWMKYADQWPEHERQLAQLTHRWGWLGVYIDDVALADAYDKLDTARQEALKKLPWVAKGGKPLSRKELERQCRKEKIPCPESLAADSPECARWEDTYASDHPWVDAIRTFRRANKHFKTVWNIKRAITKDGFFPYGMKYCAGHTGRWGGDAGVNMQNPMKKEIFGADLRKYFVPAPGKKFICSDLAQIEPRVLAWFTGNQEALDSMRSGMSPYEAAARQTLGYTDPDLLKVKDPSLYAVSKVQVLALSYGLGSNTYQEQLAACDIELTEQEAIQEVKTWRRNNKPITQLWDQFGKAFRNSVDKDGYYETILPSGRKLRYFDLAFGGKDGGVMGKSRMDRKREYFYGGKLMENAVQACARDVFANCLLNLQEWCEANMGNRIVWHVHDEAIVEVDMDITPEQIEKVMCVPPPWGEDLPLGADAFETDHYMK